MLTGSAFCKSNFFAGEMLRLPGVALATRLSVYPSRQRVVSRVGCVPAGVSRRLVAAEAEAFCRACMPARGTVDFNAKRVQQALHHRIVPQALARILGAAIVKDCQPHSDLHSSPLPSVNSCSRTPSHTRKHYKQHHASKDVHPTKNTSGGRGPKGRGRATGDPPPQCHCTLVVR